MAEPPVHPGAPRWVKVLAFISLALVAVFVVVHLAGGGFRHHGHLGIEAPTGAAEKGAP